MAKELPYFRFTSQEWQNGLISLESYHLKGLFIDICAYYWVQNCKVTDLMLRKKFKCKVELKELENAKIFKVTKSGQIKIVFLDEQLKVLSNIKTARQLAGAKGGKQKSSNAKAKLEQNSSYKDKDKDKDKDKLKEEQFSIFWSKYPNKTNKKDSLSKFLKLKDEDINKILATLDAFLKYKPFATYNHPNPTTYLNQQRWNDEIEAVKTPQGKIDPVVEQANKLIKELGL